MATSDTNIPTALSRVSGEEAKWHQEDTKLRSEVLSLHSYREFNRSHNPLVQQFSKQIQQTWCVLK